MEHELCCRKRARTHGRFALLLLDWQRTQDPQLNIGMRGTPRNLPFNQALPSRYAREFEGFYGCPSGERDIVASILASRRWCKLGAMSHFPTGRGPRG